jgi:hypothetical protein
VADPDDTDCSAQIDFDALKRLKPGEIFVCEVIGTCSRVEAEKRGIAFAPEKSG